MFHMQATWAHEQMKICLKPALGPEIFDVKSTMADYVGVGKGETTRSTVVVLTLLVVETGPPLPSFAHPGTISSSKIAARFACLSKSSPGRGKAHGSSVQSATGAVVMVVESVTSVTEQPVEVSHAVSQDLPPT